MKKSIYVLTILLMIAINSITAQVIQFQNPSFEGTPQPHVLPPGWSICIQGVTPDTQPGSWGVTLSPSNGDSYVGLVYQPSTGWQEGASQTLSTPMVANYPYSFYIDLAIPSSADQTTGIIMPPYCGQLQIWGGMSSANSGCDKAQLLWTSPTILNTTWQTYNVLFTPTANWDNILFLISAPLPACSDGQYIMMDNIVNGLPIVFENNTISVCENPATISANYSYSNYHWSNGDTTASTTVTASGTYYVTATFGSAVVTDSIHVTLTQPYLNLNLGNDTTLCDYAYLILNVGSGFADYF